MIQIPAEWETVLVVHNGEKRILLRFTNNAFWNVLVRKLEGVRWSKTLRGWHVIDNRQYRILFNLPLLDATMNALHHLANIETSNLQQIKKCVEWMRSRRYSPNTIDSYSKALGVFFVFYNQKKLQDITNEDVIYFNSCYILGNQLSATYQGQFINAL